MAIIDSSSTTEGIERFLVFEGHWGQCSKRRLHSYASVKGGIRNCRRRFVAIEMIPIPR